MKVYMPIQQPVLKMQQNMQENTSNVDEEKWYGG